MRLLHTQNLQIEEFIGNNVPEYAILSHTWGNDEVTFGDMSDGDQSIKDKAGYGKILGFCHIAQGHGFEHAWIDTCNIDKRSSAELSEAITSMYGYYRKANICFIYLADVPPLSDLDDSPRRQIEAFKRSRWFTRSWTLQELIASRTRVFLASDWTALDLSKHKLPSVNFMIRNTTKIPLAVLDDPGCLPNICVAERMSWAALRRCTREEDAAYSLMGLFGVHFTVQYGEGLRNAFKRLQLEIIKTLADCSIFCWSRIELGKSLLSSGLLASSPADFFDVPELGLWDDTIQMPFSMTKIGLHINVHIVRQNFEGAEPEDVIAFLDCDIRTTAGWGIVALRLRRVHGHKQYSVNGEKCYGYRRMVTEGLDAMPGGRITGVRRQNLKMSSLLFKSAQSSPVLRGDKR